MNILLCASTVTLNHQIDHHDELFRGIGGDGLTHHNTITIIEPKFHEII